MLHTLHTTFPELIQCLLIGVVVPRTILPAVTCPFLVRTCQRFMVTRTHAHTHIVCCLHVQWVISIEHGIPHSGPHIVTLQSEHQLKHTCIKLMIITTIILLHPSCQARSLIVQEDATITHSRFTIRIDTFLNIKLVVLLSRYICPIIPRAYTYLLTQFINAINGTTLVTARNHQLILHCHDDEHLRLALQLLDGRHFLRHLVDDGTLAHRTNHDGVIRSTRHLLQVLLQIVDGDMHTFPVVLVRYNGTLLVCQTKGSPLRGESHELLCCPHRDNSENAEYSTQKYFLHVNRF